MKTLAKLLRSSAFRLVTLFMAVFALSATLLIGYIYYNTNVLLARQLNETVEAEVHALAEQYRAGGIARLLVAVEQRAAAPGTGLYLVADARGRPLAGNLLAAPPGSEGGGEGWLEFVYERFEQGERRQHLGLGRVFHLPDGLVLLVGRDIEERRRFERVIASAVAWGLVLTLAIGIGGGVLVSRRMLARLDAMAATSRRIMAGNLSERIPETGSGDEIDRLAQSLNAMLDQIEALMRGLKEVSDNIAHDLKTPLTRLRTRAETALQEAESGAACREALERTIEESDRLIRTFDALLSIARAEAGGVDAGFVVLDAAVIVRDMAELYEPTAEERGAAIRVEAAAGLRFMGNRDLVSRALANLVDNALNHALPAPGAAAADIVIRAARCADGQIELAVLDHGPGIPPQDRERAVERFVRLEASRSRPGSGLGLSLASAVARLHRGSLRLEDNAPGLAARIVLPAAG